MTIRLVTLILLVAATPAAAQWFDWKTPVIPRTADGAVDLMAPVPKMSDGKPDFSGRWRVAEFSGSVQDPQSIRQWALDEVAAQAENFFSNDPRFHCLPSGPGAYPYSGRQIMHSPAYIAVLYPDLTYRQIFMDGRELEENPFPTWTGYSVGHWDGDTLVVESNGYNDKTWLLRDGLPHTDALRITERYTRPDFGHMRVELTYDDPDTFNSQVHGVVELRYADGDMLEQVCNESSKGARYYSGTTEEAEQIVIEVDAQTLDKYVGRYEGIWLGNDIAVDVTREGDELYIDRTPPYQNNGIAWVGKTRLVAQSQNAFECCGLGFIFSEEADGVTTEVLEVHVSGAWTFERVP